MSAKTTSSATAVILIAAVLIVAGALTIPRLSNYRNDDDDQAFVDLEADWSADHAVTVTWSVGSRVESKTIDASAPPRFGVRTVAQRGDIVGIVVSPIGDGRITCVIYINEQVAVETVAHDSEECVAETVVP